MKILWLLPILTWVMPGIAAADPCDKDRAAVCSDVSTGEGHVYDCLIGRQDRLSPDCAAAVNRATALAETVVDNCRDDAQRWCSQYSGSGRGKMIDCLKSNKNRISEACKSKYRQFKAFGFDIRS